MGNNHGEEIPEPVQFDIEKLDETNKKLNDQIQDIKTKSVQQANLFFIFQGVILLSTSSGSSSLNCHHWWIPFALSLLAAIVNVFSFHATVKYYLESSEELDQNLEDLRVMRVHKLRRDQVSLAKPGSGTLLPREEASGSREGRAHTNGRGKAIVRSKTDPVRTWKRRGLAYSGVVVLLASSGVMLYACRTILCNHNGLKCVKAC